jgi:Dna[CI] antecedent, DciA
MITNIMSNPRKPSARQRMRHSLLSAWRGTEEGPIINLPARNVSDFLQKVLKDLGLSERMQLEQVQAAWLKAAGEFLAKQSTPDNVLRGVLTVRVVQSSVLYALNMEKARLLRSLNESLAKTTVIKDIRFRHG